MSGPRYTAIADDLRAQIDSGTLRPGARLPSHRDLAARYQVSGMTIRQALAALTAEGLITSHQGAGVRVRTYRRLRSDRIRRLSAASWGAGISIWSADATGRDLRVDDITIDRATPPPHIAAALGSTDGVGEAIRRSRTFYIDSHAVQRATSWIPASIAAGTPIEHTDTGPGGTYARLADLGHTPTAFVEQVTARPPTRGEADQLGILPGTPLLVVTRTTATDTGRIVEITEILMDASAITLAYSWTSTEQPR